MAFTAPEMPLASAEPARQRAKRDASTPDGRSRIARGSSAKGAQGERDVLNAFRDVMRNVETELSEQGHSFVARSDFANRKRIEKGTSNRDIGNIPLISIEVKRNENLNINAAWDQTIRQAGTGLLPTLVYRYNREAWRVRTFVALTSYDRTNQVVSYAVGEVDLPSFLSYYKRMYQAYLSEGT